MISQAALYLLAMADRIEQRKKAEQLLILLEDLYGRSPDPVIDPLMISERYSASIIPTNRLKQLITTGWLDQILTNEEYIFLKERYGL